jgi:hypothetical protein
MHPHPAGQMLGLRSQPMVLQNPGAVLSMAQREAGAAQSLSVLHARPKGSTLTPASLGPVVGDAAADAS